MADDKKTEENIETPVSMVDDILSNVSEKINDAESILVALSKDPNVDEMTAAIGMTMALDKMGKHAIAIYSGKTPNALEFLKPEDTFEPNTNSLQDFIIALNKEKADHLRYKIEGDFVKVYITPYKTTISESDLEFSHGEVNVDLIISFDVEEIEDLDAALEKHGRIMHDAGSINISNGKPGRIGGVEWNKPEASSVSEMVSELLEYMGQTIDKNIATALLTGIVAATERFSNEKTTPSTMTIASNLMKNGADQQLIISNINKKGEKEAPKEDEAAEDDGEIKDDSLEVEHNEEQSKEPEESAEAQLEKMLGAKEEEGSVKPASAQQVMDELRAIATSNAEQAEKAEKPAETVAPVQPKTPESVLAAQVPKVESGMMDLPTETFKPLASDTISEFAPRGDQVIEPEKTDTVAAVPTANVPAAAVYGVGADRTDLHDGRIDMSDDIARPKDYSKMMEEALGETEVAQQPMNPAVAAAPEVPSASAQEQNLDDMVNQMVNKAQVANGQVVSPNMAGAALPQAPAPTLGNGMMPPTEPSLPPVQVSDTPIPEMTQPMGAVDMSGAATNSAVNPAVAAAPAEVQDESAVVGVPEVAAGVEAAPEPVNPVIVQPVSDPGAFKIPGI